jgi:hypothetical protein
MNQDYILMIVLAMIAKQIEVSSLSHEKRYGGGMKVKEGYKRAIAEATKAGFYKGLLEGLLLSTKESDGIVQIDAEIFHNVRKAFDKFNKQIQDKEKG